MKQLDEDIQDYLWLEKAEAEGRMHTGKAEQDAKAGEVDEAEQEAAREEEEVIKAYSNRNQMAIRW